jgi:hypothetical protein
MEIGIAATDQKSVPDTPLSGGYTQNVPDINNFDVFLTVHHELTIY